MTTTSTHQFDAHATVREAEQIARRTFARLDPLGDDGLGRVRINVHGGSSSWFNRLTRSVSIGTGHERVLGPNGQLELIETTIHELAHKWVDRRAGWGGLLYAGSPGRVSEGLSQVVAGASMALEGTTPDQRAWGWQLLDPRGKTTPMPKFPRGSVDVPLSVTMDDVAAKGFTLADTGFVHVHSGVVQEGHLQIARRIGMEPMAKLTVETARRELGPLTGIRGWAAATLRTAEHTFGASSSQALAVRQAWQAAKVVLPG
jgi:hypothetical protein